MQLLTKKRLKKGFSVAQLQFSQPLNIDRGRQHKYMTTVT